MTEAGVAEKVGSELYQSTTTAPVNIAVLSPHS